MFNASTIVSERLRRQRLTYPLESREDYVELFRLLQPVSTIANTRPGAPPSLVHRTRFNDEEVSSALRADRDIVKGRFLGGSIGYVLAEDLELYANAFQRPLSHPNPTQYEVLDALRSAGPLTPRQLKEETGLLNKVIMPALHRLQKAFLVYEDQVDEDWERSWYEFAAEWPEITIDKARQKAAASRVLLRFLEAHVFATYEQLKDWSQFSKRLLDKLLKEMEDDGKIVSQNVVGLGEGWSRVKDATLPAQSVPPSVFMLHRADFLTRSHKSELKQCFEGLEVLQYLLIDGKFQGAVVGHWRIGPHDVDDIALTLPAKVCAARREEILAAVAQTYHPPRHHILRYAGLDII